MDVGFVGSVLNGQQFAIQRVEAAAAGDDIAAGDLPGAQQVGDVVRFIPVIGIEIGDGVEAVLVGEDAADGPGGVAVIGVGFGQGDVDGSAVVAEERVRVAVGDQEMRAGMGLAAHAGVALAQDGVGLPEIRGDNGNPHRRSLRRPPARAVRTG